MRKSSNLVLAGLFIMTFLSFSDDDPKVVSYNRKQLNGFVLATWNIGHFANGEKGQSTIRGDSFELKKNDYRQFIYNNISSDLLCVNELSSIFGVDSCGINHSADSLLFDHFKIKWVGKQIGWCCNAIFSNVRVNNIRINEFESTRPFWEKDKHTRIWYYLSAKVFVNGRRIDFVCVHLVSKRPKECQLQIKELLEKYKSCDRVIMCGDWNTNNYSAIKDAGYYIANDGLMVTFPKKKYALDNIVVKGLKISEVRVIKTDLSDHYPLVCRISVQ